MLSLSPLTVDHGISSSDEILQTDLFQRWHPMTVPYLNSLSSLERPIFSQMFLNGYEILYVYVCKMYSEGQVQNSKMLTEALSHKKTIITGH